MPRQNPERTAPLHLSANQPGHQIFNLLRIDRIGLARALRRDDDGQDRCVRWKAGMTASGIDAGDVDNAKANLCRKKDATPMPFSTGPMLPAVRRCRVLRMTQHAVATVAAREYLQAAFGVTGSCW